MEIKHIFQNELKAIFDAAEKMGLSAIEISSGSLEQKVKIVGRTPACCNAMRGLLQGSDGEIRKANVIQDSTTNTFRYHIPRSA